MTPEQILNKNEISERNLSYSRALISMHEYGKQCFEAARNTHGDSYDNGDYIYDEFEDYIKSFSIPKQNT